MEAGIPMAPLDLQQPQTSTPIRLPARQDDRKLQVTVEAVDEGSAEVKVLHLGTTTPTIPCRTRIIIIHHSHTDILVIEVTDRLVSAAILLYSSHSIIYKRSIKY
jgi:hypothetical protein